jgi:O-antigen/teichoic acid export membrane protein
MTLRRNFSWTFAGNVINAAAQFGMLLVLAKLGDAEKVGQYGLALALTAPLFLFVGMSLRSVLVTDIGEEYSIADYVGLRVLGMAVGMLSLATIVASVGYSWQSSVIILLIGLSKSIEGLSDIVFGVFQRMHRMDLIARSTILKAGATLLAFSFVLWATNSLPVAVVSMCVVWLVRFGVFDVSNLLGVQGNTRSRRSLFKSFGQYFLHLSDRADCLWKLLVFALPLGLASSVTSLSSSVPRYVLERFEGVGELGIFTVLAYPLAAGNIVISALSQSSLPRLAQYSATANPDAFWTLLRKLLILGAGLAVVAFIIAAAFGEYLLRALFGAVYAAEHDVFTILILGMGVGFVNWFLNAALQALRVYRSMLFVQMSVLAFTIAASIFIVPGHGIEGAAWVMLASAMIQVGIKLLLVPLKLHTLASSETGKHGL